MTTYPFTAEDLDALRAWDTPTICNGLEIIAPERRAIGFTVAPMVVVDGKLPPIVGLARTGMIRANEPPRGSLPPREDWYEYCIADGLPTIAVLQDLDDPPGFGAFWGEVHTAVHAGLGVRGCATNGSFRDIDMLAPGFHIVGGRIGPSHAHVYMVEMNCDVNILVCSPGTTMSFMPTFTVRLSFRPGPCAPAQGDRTRGAARKSHSRARALPASTRAQCARRSASLTKSTNSGEEGPFVSSPLRARAIDCGFFADNHLGV